MDALSMKLMAHALAHPADLLTLRRISRVVGSGAFQRQRDVRFKPEGRATSLQPTFLTGKDEIHTAFHVGVDDAAYYSSQPDHLRLCTK